MDRIEFLESLSDADINGLCAMFMWDEPVKLEIEEMHGQFCRRLQWQDYCGSWAYAGPVLVRLKDYGAGAELTFHDKPYVLVHAFSEEAFDECLTSRDPGPLEQDTWGFLSVDIKSCAERAIAIAAAWIAMGLEIEGLPPGYRVERLDPCRSHVYHWIYDGGQDDVEVFDTEGAAIFGAWRAWLKKESAILAYLNEFGFYEDGDNPYKERV